MAKQESNNSIKITKPGNQANVSNYDLDVIQRVFYIDNHGL